MNLTPLRYPGGKSVMTPFFVDLFNANSMKNTVYAEPYAGGAGTAINLLLDNNVDKIIINDANVCIYSFWYYLLKYKSDFINRVRDIEVTIAEWYKQREILRQAKQPSFDVGFATFFLSRTNRSGILTAGAIGGNSQEKQDCAKYKIDCRFNKEDLCTRMSNIVERANQIEVSNEDALDFLGKISNNNAVVYLDPPYYVNGKSLYMNYYTHDDHLELSKHLKGTDKYKWILSYDNAPEIRQMYLDFELYSFELSYTAQNVKQGSELLTHSKNIILPANKSIRRASSDIALNKIIL
ncbi:DNA adenine methylase [Bacteroides uniformis]|uniref:DNA adenine methylase n=1 Tax=Bacteroides uniformis TaxID=820 RepID=UPI0039B485D2